ncbi:MAG: Fic family protein [Desulfosporosinus sp.]
MNGEIYCYPGTNVLINKLNIEDPISLTEKERQFTGFRLVQLEQDPMQGSFDLSHLQKIHKHLFQDIYSWAGQLRIVDISKGNTLFALSHNLKPLFEDLFVKLKKDEFLSNLNIENFSERLAYYTSEINAYHPFREGNGRSTREFIRCLANKAGYLINYSQIGKPKLYQALVKSFDDYTDLREVFKSHITDTIKKRYLKELLGIENAPELLLVKLNKIRVIDDDQEFCSRSCGYQSNDDRIGAMNLRQMGIEYRHAVSSQA